MNNEIKLSICCITYNHEDFIRQALDSFLMQKTNFKFEVLVHDDASTDRTQEIIKEYAEKYPEIIKPILQTENKWSQGIYVDKVYNWPRIQGKYVALCEGDDYWTDKYKLQKQIDFLDSHPDYTICFHRVKVIYEDESQKESYFPSYESEVSEKNLTFSDLVRFNFIQTNSVIYRWQLKGKEEIFPKNILPCDYFLHLIHAQKGKIGFLPDIMAVYRKHEGGIWWGCGETDEWFIRCGIPHIQFYKEVQKMFYVDKSNESKSLAAGCIKAFLKHKEFAKLESLAKKFPEEYNSFFYSDASCNSESIKKTLISKLIHQRKKIAYFIFIIFLILLIWIRPEKIFNF